MTVRGAFAAWLEAQPDAPAGLRVVDNPRTVDPLPKLFVHLARTSVDNPAADSSGTARAGVYLHQLDVWLVTGTQDPAKAEDPLDDALDWLLDAFAGNAWLLWTTATRAAYDEGRGNAYRIPITLKSIPERND